MNWKYWVSRNVDAYSENWVSVIVADAALKRGFLKTRTSSMGWSVWRSHHQNGGRTTAAIAKPPITTGSLQPDSGAWMIPPSRADQADDREQRADRVEGALLGRLRLRDEPARQEEGVAQIGTLMRKTADHPNCSTSTPPSTGPSAIPTPLTPAQMPIARARSCGPGTCW